MTVKFSLDYDGVIKLYDVLGNSIRTEIITNGLAHFDTSALSNGIYTLSCQNESMSITKHFIINH